MGQGSNSGLVSLNDTIISSVFLPLILMLFLEDKPVIVSKDFWRWLTSQDSPCLICSVNVMSSMITETIKECIISIKAAPLLYWILILLNNVSFIVCLLYTCTGGVQKFMGGLEGGWDCGVVTFCSRYVPDIRYMTVLRLFV